MVEKCLHEIEEALFSSLLFIVHPNEYPTYDLRLKLEAATKALMSLRDNVHLKGGVDPYDEASPVQTSFRFPVKQQA